MSLPEPKEKPILLRLPEKDIIVLDSIVAKSKGKYKSRNELVMDIIGEFLTQLRQKAEEEGAGGKRV